MSTNTKLAEALRKGRGLLPDASLMSDDELAWDLEAAAVLAEFDAAKGEAMNNDPDWLNNQSFRDQAAYEALAAHDAEQAQAAKAVPADMLPSAEHIKEIAGELVTQAMEQAQVFASAWALVGSRFDAGNEMDNAEQQKADLRTIIQTLADLAAETVRPIAAAPAAPAPEAQE